MEPGWRIAALVLSTAGYVLAFILIPRIILERRQPAATVAWVLAIALLPIVGVPLYFLAGERRIRRHIRAKIRAAGSVQRSREVREAPERFVAPAAGSCVRALNAAGALPPVSGNRASLIDAGEEAFRTVHLLIGEAQDHIHAQFFILDADRIGKGFVDALADRARKGIRVRLLLDAVGSWRALHGMVRPLRKAGGEVATFLPAFPIQRRWSAHLRNHRKLLIADGRQAFTGGMNIGRKYMGPGPDAARWRDKAVLVRGPAVHDLQALFLDDWAFATGESRPCGQLFPPFPEEERQPERDSVLQVVASGPDRKLRPIYQGLFTAIIAARKRVWIETPYFVPDDAIGTALENAALRGIDVRLIVPERGDMKMVTLAGRSYFEELMRAGVGIYRYRPTLLHAKAVLVDDTVAIVGSSNVDIRSFFLNFELGLFLYSDADVARVAASLEEDLSRSVRLNPVTFERRSKAVRLLEDSCRIFSPLF